MKIYAHSGPHLWLLLWRSYHAVLEREQANLSEAGFGILSEYAVLEVLLQRGPQPVNTLGKRVLLTSGSITTAVDRLSRRGWVRREQDARDKRVIRVHLTPAGRERIEAGFTRHVDGMDQLFACLEAEERAELARLLGKVEAAARELSCTNALT